MAVNSKLSAAKSNNCNTTYKQIATANVRLLAAGCWRCAWHGGGAPAATLAKAKAKAKATTIAATNRVSLRRHFQLSQRTQLEAEEEAEKIYRKTRKTKTTAIDLQQSERTKQCTNKRTNLLPSQRIVKKPKHINCLWHIVSVESESVCFYTRSIEHVRLVVTDRADNDARH